MKLKRLLNILLDKERKEILRVHAKRHGKTIRMAKRSYNRDVHEKQKPKEYWELINYDKPSLGSGNKPIEEFQRHFEALVSQNISDGTPHGEGRVNLGLDLDNLKNEAINGEFTVEEVKAHVKN